MQFQLLDCRGFVEESNLKNGIRFAIAGAFAMWLPLVHAASVVSATPQGEVAQVRQVAIKFSEAVVPFGDPRLPDPFTVTCQGAVPAGAGRWSSDREWLYDFREALPPGTRCVARVRADWKPPARP
ncbi:MAG: hypothetical protein ABI364_08400, partial [Caldimonas sp.]